jgi:glycosyltransferase involved in cell wall biosynthesis
VEPFLLFVGTRERRKNALGLINVFARVRAQRSDVTLVIVGMRPDCEAKHVHGVEKWNGREVEERIAEYGLTQHVRVLGHVSFRDLVALYSAASVLVYPTYYEGFGFPALEAMACGLPVVVSSRSSLPEVVGDAGTVVDPDDPDAFAAGVLLILADEALRMRRRVAGIRRAAQFTWEATALGVLRVYAELLDGK